jgi:hypothetical protein
MCSGLSSTVVRSTGIPHFTREWLAVIAVSAAKPVAWQQAWTTLLLAERHRRRRERCSTTASNRIDAVPVTGTHEATGWYDASRVGHQPPPIA